jgi:hypothetical protein
MLCLYRAPDAEAVRRAQKQAQMPFDTVWPCTPFHDPTAPPAAGAPAASREAILVEREFGTPMAVQDLLKLAAEGEWCLKTYRATYVEGYISLDGLRMVCHFLAPDAESVRLANDRMKIPWRVAWPATVHEP